MKQNKLFPFYGHVYFTDSNNRTELSSLSWEDAGIFVHPTLLLAIGVVIQPHTPGWDNGKNFISHPLFLRPLLYL